jgi:putrescine aminotransferase
MNSPIDEAIKYAERWTEIIHASTLSDAEAKQIIDESKVNFAEHFNKGWLDYRKSITEAGDWAATEWTGSGAMFRTCSAASTSTAWAATG